MINQVSAFSSHVKTAVVGHFQVGKSTLVNCLLRRRAAICGDSTMPTTARTQGYPSDRGPILLLDTPGINAEEAHTKEMEDSIRQADFVILVVSNQRALSEPLRNLVTLIGQKRIPLYTVINCWDDKVWNDGDPETVKRELIETIEGQIAERVDAIGVTVVNIEWAAAARGCLEDEKRAEDLRNNKTSLEQQSMLPELEDFLFPDPMSAFSPYGLECAVLSSKFVCCLRAK